MSHIICQGNGTWKSIMSENINNCHLHLVSVSDGPKTHGTYFPTECIPLDDPFYPEHPDNTQQKKTKAGVLPVKDVKLKLQLQVSLARKLLPMNLLLTLS